MCLQIAPELITFHQDTVDSGITRMNACRAGIFAAQAGFQVRQSGLLPAMPRMALAEIAGLVPKIRKKCRDGGMLPPYRYFVVEEMPENRDSGIENLPEPTVSILKAYNWVASNRRSIDTRDDSVLHHFPVLGPILRSILLGTVPVIINLAEQHH